MKNRPNIHTAICRRTTPVLPTAAALSLMLTVSVAAEDADRIRAFGNEIRQHASLLRLPGCATAVLKDGEVVFRHETGFADVATRTRIGPDSLFWIASVTKTFSAVMTMQYVEEGTVDLDDPIVSYPFTSVGFFPGRATPRVQLRHVLSHTSEGTPGERFLYHGGRYNFLMGMFNHARGRGSASFVDEMNTRILQPLKLDSTFAGVPAEDDENRDRLVTSYRFDKDKRQFVPDPDESRANTAYPAAGLLTSVSDLLKYSAALDENKLIDGQAYREMTTPMKIRSGIEAPYGFGWFVQEAHGVVMHWAYGLGASESALLLRVPERNLTLVVLANCGFASAPFRLGSGNVLNSPFAVAFLKHFVLQIPAHHMSIDYDQPATLRDVVSNAPAIELDALCAQAFARTYIERKFGEDSHAEDLLRILFEIDEERFLRAHPSLMNLLSHHPNEALNVATRRVLKSVRSRYGFHPEVEFDAARRLERQGQIADALTGYMKVADRAGFVEQESTIRSCSEAARLLMDAGDLERALEYQWRGITYAHRAGHDVRSRTDAFHRMTKRP